MTANVVGAGKQQLLSGRCGVLFFRSPSHPAFEAILAKLPLLGTVAVSLHPAIASAFGAQASQLFGAFAVALLLPTLRTIVIAPFLAILAVSIVMAAYLRSPDAIFSGLAAYAFFHLMTYKSRLSLMVFLAIGTVAAIVSVGQFLFPNSVFNVHATAESFDDIINKYRPTSIFPAQVYFNQALLLAVPLVLLAAEDRRLVMALLGAAGAISGSTAGLVFAVLMLVFKHGYFALIGFAAALSIVALISFDAVAYNYSPWDFMNSFAIRLGDPGGPLSHTGVAATSDAITTGAATAGMSPNLSSVVEFLALGGILLALMLVLTSRGSVLSLLQLGVAVGAVLLTQILHPTMGTLFFAPFLGALTALEWRVVHRRRPP